MLRHTEGWTVAEAERGVEGMSGTKIARRLMVEHYGAS